MRVANARRDASGDAAGLGHGATATDRSIDVARSSSRKVQTPRSIDTVERSIDT